MESGGKGEGKKNMKKMEAWEKRLNLRVRAKEFVRVTPLLITPSASEVEEDDDVSKNKGAAAPAPAPAPAGAIRKGYFPVYVGEEKERFVIKTQLLSHPQFKVLLEEAKLQYGYTNGGGGGPLLLPCHVDTFHQLLAEMEKISTSSNATGGRPPEQQMMNFTSTTTPLSLGRSLICRFRGGNGQPSWRRRHYHNYTLLDRLKN